MTEFSTPSKKVSFRRPITEGHEVAVPADNLKIRFTTFEDASKARRPIPDKMIDMILANERGGGLEMQIGEEMMGLKGFLDKVQTNPEEKAIIDSPEAIAEAYLRMTEMVYKNLKILAKPEMTAERAREILTAKDTFLLSLSEGSTDAADAVISWCKKAADRPGKYFGYYGMNIDGKDALERGENTSDYHPNIMVQRQVLGNFIFGYSDARIAQRMTGQKEVLDRRVYLNPEIMSAPGVFEKLLGAANEAGLPIELKVFQRAEELGAAHILKERGQGSGDAIRGDGIVVCASADKANDVLALVLAIAQDNPYAFVGRKLSRTPQRVADGIAVGVEPRQRAGQDAESLTSARESVLSLVGKKVASSGKTGAKAREAFRRGLDYYGAHEDFDPNNLAFRQAA